MYNLYYNSNSIILEDYFMDMELTTLISVHLKMPSNWPRNKMPNIYYKTYDTAKKEYILIPVEVVEGSVNKSGDFGRKDCIITPIGGEGKLKVDYMKLVIKK